MQFLHSITSNTPDSELVAAYKKTGDQEILGELYGRYLELVYGVCLKYLKQPENAQDSTMLIYGEITTKLLKHEVEHFRPWLYTLAKNHCLMRLRSEKKHKTVDFDVALVQSEADTHLNGVLQKEENFQILTYCMNQLDDQQKQSIELFYLQGKCYNEIATITGLEWNRVRSFIQNGKRNLKICMEKQKAKSAYNNE